MLAAILLLAATVPAGFHLDVYARDLGNAGMLLALDDGTLLVSRPELNDVIALRDRDGDGRADEARTVMSSIQRAHGLALRDNTLYVAGVKKIVAAERLTDTTFGKPYEVVSDLPDGGQHPLRTIAFGPDGKLYVSIGSSCSECAESNPEHATLLQLDPDGGHRRIYARGLRNMRGFDWHPETRELWGADGSQAIHRIGDGLRYCCAGGERAALELPRETSAGFAFYRGNQFPAAFRGDAFSASRGSCVRVRYRNGKPVAFEDFATGFDGSIGGVTVSKDGSLFLSDEENGVVYRVAYGNRIPPPMTSSAAEELPKPVLSKAFRVGELRNPESVLHDEEQDVYLVSNVDGPATAKDGNGFIARVTPDGRIENRTFIDGLDAPKGMAIRADELWIADIDKLRVFDRATGAPIRTMDLAPHGAVFLNDVAVGGDGAIYVTDSDLRIKGTRERVRAGDGRIYRIGRNGNIEIAMHGEELRSPSGIAWDGLQFLVAQSYGRDILGWHPGNAVKTMMSGPGAYDGVVVLPNGTVIVSSHHDDTLHVAYGNADLQPLFAAKPTPAGIGFDRKRNQLLIPSLEGGWLEAWKLPPMEQEKTAAREKKEFAKRD